MVVYQIRLGGILDFHPYGIALRGYITSRRE